MKREYNKGFYEAMDKVMNWINSQDETDNKEFRSLLYKFCLDSRP